MGSATMAMAVYPLPGQAVFPESVGVDPISGDAFVGSLADGAIYRIAPDQEGEAALFSSAGADGRNSVAGVKIDSRRRLWAAGGYDGTLYVLRASDGELLGRAEVRGRPSCVNDIAFGPDSTGYVTDSFQPVLYRVDGESLALSEWVDLAAQGVPWPDGLNFNGIVLTPDERHLVVCQTNLGRFWRIALATGEVAEVSLSGGPLEHCDGLAIHGSTLFVAVNARNEIVTVELDPDGASGRVGQTVTSAAFAFPTAVAVRGGSLLVVNGQLDRMGGTPQLPFTVVSIERPEG